LANAPDTLAAATRQYRPRQVDIDGFRSYSTELRMQHDYRLGHLHATWTAGLRYIHNDLHRRQLGTGSTGTDYDLSVSGGGFKRDVHLKTQNVAAFAENLLRLSRRWELSAGMRMEGGQSNMSGSIVYLPEERVPQRIEHRYPLFGISTQYRLGPTQVLYGGWSQAYRPVIFADLIPANFLERTDPDMRDAFGYNAELGWKGKIGGLLTFDVSAFQLLYRHRIGSLVLSDEQGQSYIWKTNIGDSRTDGLELYAEARLSEGRTHKLSVFSASSYMRGRYLNGQIRNGSQNEDLSGKGLETLPTWMSRSGLQVAYKSLAMILQHNYVAASYSDALNTRTPSADGSRGIVPAYQIWDWNMAYRLGLQCTLRFGINNLTNAQYFTKRPTGYPGQGVWSSDGRGFVASLGLKW
ncbi:MAG TPA: TonB-dependent receptor, partial [Saprospiraceae bacterium]|nr:TonB-dependent receptor [Saprospiraceae bacterium]